MNDKLFVIAIGGTGMRCLESFVHLCAIGMFDNQEIEVMMLDTDSANGNLGRTEKLIDNYIKVKTSSGDQIGGTPNSDTFFSAKINFYKFCTDYNDPSRITYKNLSRLNDGDKEIQEENKMLADLFLENDTVQEFNLDHGYRAQTHLGSQLMYHGIVEAARKLKDGNNIGDAEKKLDLFLQKLEKAGESARVFVFGSVFGGTGASSIPIIPVAFRDAIYVRSNGNSTLNLEKTKFGSTLLTEYFSFKKPDMAQMSAKKDRIVADSSFFPLNSQAALQFYQGDPTVQSAYKRLYHIGWPLESKNVSKDKTITGGAEQKNGCHIVELLCACAAYDFFTLPEDQLHPDRAQYLFRAIEFENNAFNFSPEDLVGQKGEVFMNKLGAFFNLAHIVLAKNKAAWGDQGTKGFLTQLQQNKVNEYSTIDDNSLMQIDSFLRMFGYEFDSNNQFVPGWIYQVKSSVEPGNFIFKSDAFKTMQRDLEKIGIGDIFLDDKHNWSKGGLLSDRYDHFVKTFVDNGSPTDDQHVNTTHEKFLAHIYNGITISQNFKKA